MGPTYRPFMQALRNKLSYRPFIGDPHLPVLESVCQSTVLNPFVMRAGFQSIFCGSIVLIPCLSIFIFYKFLKKEEVELVGLGKIED